jgi:elongation factor P
LIGTSNDPQQFTVGNLARVAHDFIYAIITTDMALAYTDLTKGVLFIMDGAPYEVIETHFLRMQQRKAVVQTRIRNLITGKLLDRNFQASDSFEEAEIERKHAIFIYESKGQYWFHEENNPKARFALEADVAGEQAQFLKPNTRVQTMVFKDKVIKIEIPVKMDFKVIEAPPSLKGNTAQGGNKVVTIEGGAKISAPLFVNEGDMIRVNTQTGDYVERV